MAQLFTIAEAERLLPQVERLLRDALSLRSEAAQAHKELEQATGHIRMAGGARINPGKILAIRARRDTSIAALKDVLERIAETGAVVKDLDIGLIDFMSRFRDREVCLCWKLGESGILFWHGADEGYRGRKPIDREFLEGHSGEQSSAGGRLQ